MNEIVNMIVGDITEVNELTIFVVVVRIIVLILALETFGVVCGHLASVGK